MVCKLQMEKKAQGTSANYFFERCTGMSPESMLAQSEILEPTHGWPQIKVLGGYLRELSCPKTKSFTR
jgi:hypothetical protein